MISVEEAQERIQAQMMRLPSETVAVEEAHGRVLAQDVTAQVALPPFDNSAMDGYAVLASDLAAASGSRPVRLTLLGATPAGQAAGPRVTTGRALRIFTGSLLPAGADAVVMQEDTRAEGNEVVVLDAVKPWENIRFRGEDVKYGERIAAAGTLVNASLLAILSATGHATIRVSRQPRVGLLSTGDELGAPGTPLRAGQIYESHRAMLSAMLRDSGAEPVVYPIVADQAAATEQALERAFAECDAVMTTGGVSVGEHDHVKAAFEKLGGRIEFWRVAMRPGKPFVFGKRGEKFLFGLPGNPVSAFVTFVLLVRPALWHWQGRAHTALRRVPGRLAEPVSNDTPRRHFMRVVLENDGSVRSAGPQASHRIASLAAANALLDVPAGAVWPAGESVSVLLL